MIKHLNKTVNIGIVAHVDAGKTTITEQLLYKTGIIDKIGRVDTGDTVTDGMTLEKQRGITIKASTVAFHWNNTKIQLLDTPGHMDFIAEVERSLSVLDGVVLAISAREGVQPQTRVIFNAVKRLGIPMLIFINKVDRMGVDLIKVYDEIDTYLTPDALVLEAIDHMGTRDVVIKSYKEDEALKLENYEKLAMRSEAFINTYLNETGVTDDVFESCVKEGFQMGTLYPVIHGCALHGVGINQLLEMISTWFEPKVQEALYGRVYKVDRDKMGNRRCYVRLFGGHLTLRKSYPVYGREEPVKIRNLGLIKGAITVAVEQAEPGDIAIIWSDELQIEDVLGAPLETKTLQHLSEPTLKATVATPNLAIRKSVLQALTVLTDEDPFLNFRIHPITEAVEVTLFGIVQKEIIEALLLERFGIETTIEEPGVIFMETPVSESHACLRMYSDHFLPATVGLFVEPLPLGTGVKYITAVSFGDLKKSFQNAVEEGVRMGLVTGPRGWRVSDVQVTFETSEFDSVSSTPADFRKTAKAVVQKALEQVEMELLEPILSFEIEVPLYAIGRVISDVLKMRGSGDAPVIFGEVAVITGELPAQTSQRYAMELADYTEGKGAIMMQFKRWGKNSL